MGIVVSCEDRGSHGLRDGGDLGLFVWSSWPLEQVDGGRRAGQQVVLIPSRDCFSALPGKCPSVGHHPLFSWQ